MQRQHTIHPKKYAHGFVVLCFVVVMQSFIMNSHEVFINIHQGCFAGTGAIVRLPQCQWSKPDGYEEISQCITITKHSKAVTVCIFLRIYCNSRELTRHYISVELIHKHLAATHNYKSFIWHYQPASDVGVKRILIIWFTITIRQDHIFVNVRWIFPWVSVRKT